MASAWDVKRRNVSLMEASRGYDVTIVCTSDENQAKYWEQRLNERKGTVIPKESCVIAVDEDWPGGAGNFLGTLYAWQKACAKHKERTGEDLAQLLDSGKSMALFHTAGKGTRLAPLPGAENNNKPGVKLPAPGLPSILESVIRQTGAYASSRGRRLSVFWGDQVFVPSVSNEYKPNFHVDIVCALGPMPSAEEWAERGLEKYGLILAKSDDAVAAMMEKVTHAEASSQLAKMEGVDQVGTSLGSFSLSSAILNMFMTGFSAELDAKSGKLDSDPHVWMVMTLSEDDYQVLAVKKGLFDEAGARAHHQRVKALIASFDASLDGLTGGLFGAVTVGRDVSWWDYGLLKLYRQNSLLLTDGSEDAALARSFFSVEEASRVSSSELGATVVDSDSVVSETRTKGGKITSSSIAKVAAEEIDAEGAVLVNVCAKKVKAGKGAVAYNVVDMSEAGLVLGENEVRVGVFTLNGDRPYFEMKSDAAAIDGGKVFKEKVCENPFSFQEVYDLNNGADVIGCAAKGAATYQERAAAIGLS
eukprot:TRINITY_DN9436_c0_g3_i1.p1 TRINITY_DN9436_c0_g3~~TRINITY_DN9436_c0_g3_i1.p1  ORF type:complete len:559 (-),score=115.37 TRINITY_DN9436_c0_g3_i1:189-1781(-)